MSKRIAAASPSIMSELLRQARQLKDQGRAVVDLGAGVPDYRSPDFLLEAAVNALRTGNNSYGDSRGELSLRQAIAARYTGIWKEPVCADSEVTITAGASAALNTVLLALTERYTGVVMFDPSFEPFQRQLKLAGCVPMLTSLRDKTWSIDFDELAFLLGGPGNDVLLLNTPHNPTGRVFTQAELSEIARLCVKFGTTVIADETYEPFVYDHPHLSIADMPGMRERTVTIASVSKVFNVSGWRVGSIVASPALTEAIRVVNELSLGAPVPLQTACAEAMSQYDSFTDGLVEQHRPLRDQLAAAVDAAGLHACSPEGTLSMLADVKALGKESDTAACQFLLNEYGLLVAPGAAFFTGKRTEQYVRLSFARTQETITEAVQALRALRASTSLWI